MSNFHSSRCDISDILMQDLTGRHFEMTPKIRHKYLAQIERKNDLRYISRYISRYILSWTRLESPALHQRSLRGQNALQSRISWGRLRMKTYFSEPISQFSEFAFFEGGSRLRFARVRVGIWDSEGPILDFWVRLTFSAYSDSDDIISKFWGKIRLLT